MSSYKHPQSVFVESVDAPHGSSAKLLASLRLPAPVKAILPWAAIDTLRLIRARVLSHRLPRNRVFEQPSDHGLASASMSIIVAIHDAPLVTKRCLASLERYARDAEVILVDDASRIPATVDMIREFGRCNGWKVISNSEAGGHSAACAAGASLGTRPYLCLLNSDTVVTPWCWRPIQEAFETDPAIGVAGPSTSTYGNEQAVDEIVPCRFHWNDSQICAFAERLSVAPRKPVIMDLPCVLGFAFFIRRCLWERLGGFDCNLPDYGNEIELCNRVSKIGYRIVWVRSSYIHHFGRQSYANEIADHELRSRATMALEYVRQKHG